MNNFNCLGANVQLSTQNCQVTHHTKYTGHISVGARHRHQAYDIIRPSCFGYMSHRQRNTGLRTLYKWHCTHNAVPSLQSPQPRVSPMHPICKRSTIYATKAALLQCIAYFIAATADFFSTALHPRCSAVEKKSATNCRVYH